MIARLFLAATLSLACTTLSASELVLTFPDGRSIALSSSTLAALKRESISATSHDITSTYEGYDLASVLKTVGSMSTESLRGKDLARTIVVSATDRYRVVFSLAELDPTLGNRQVYLVNQENGKPLADKDGPWRLVIPADKRPARWIRQVSSIAISD
ncbi:MAG: hypothetical protein ABI866_00840 [Dokdonella sp.]